MRQPKLKLELLQSLTPMTKTMSGDGGIDLEEVTIHGTAPGNGGDPGGYNPVNPSFPTFPVGGGSGGSGSGGSGNAGGGAGGSGSNGDDDEAGGGGGGGGPIEWEQPGIMPGDLSCRSFKFQQVGTSNSQSAIVTGLPSPTFSVAGGGNSSRSFPLGDIIVDAPLTLANGTTISAGTAAAAAAEAANDAVKILGTIYGLGNKWRTATDATYERDFITTMETFLKVAVPGARVQKRGTDGRTGVSPSKAEYDGYLDWLFGTGC
ncbi:hypothetical protein [Pedobacter sp. MR22-3]|uniref:hypothetical protein n=1 Tax=Pedobacter sp. MR22-3 TaxID=2994552 RepID=UPI002245F03B|nr:hypothetical protein [Pedobacter sp. MR22-3]MCX2585930.1 hypothetical protein [Pedobacter sp. MR22-3]